jgi:tetratricopeptide (TPR) repeat protein
MIFIGKHIGKTGGSSLGFNLKNHLGDKFSHYGPLNNRLRFFAEQDLFTSFSHEQHQKLTAFLGHGVDETLIKLLPSSEISLFTVFRDPYEHSISRYFYSVSKAHPTHLPCSQEDFAAKLPKEQNFISRQFVRAFPSLAGSIDLPLQERVINVLRHFRFLMCTERLDEQSELLFDAIGIPAMTEKRRVTSKKTAVIWSREDVYENSPVDLYIHKLIMAQKTPALNPNSFLNPFGYDAESSRLKFESMKKSINKESLVEIFNTNFVTWLNDHHSLPAAKLLVTHSEKYRGTKLAKLIQSFEVKEDLSFEKRSVQNMNLGQVYAYLDQPKKSIECFEKALEENPDNLRAKELLERCMKSNTRWWTVAGLARLLTHRPRQQKKSPQFLQYG